MSRRKLLPCLNGRPSTGLYCGISGIIAIDGCMIGSLPRPAFSLSILAPCSQILQLSEEPQPITLRTPAP
ncbi:hypothetical protein V6N11_033831 [Hibiscus sabdariffa]|uniref:Uncharacterized protein n=1 Tax=Hibiscus sabdariffa TaxID=183260 RepID=A0ABR2S1H4_9ROSI